MSEYKTKACNKCWNNFESVTTISKESRADNSSKRLAPEMGDDIV